MLPRASEGRLRESATDLVYGRVRDDILRLDLLPGAMIDKACLCEQFGVSRSPVSEALARLQADGLVEIIPQRGTRVARIRMTDIYEAIFIRRSIEVEVVRTIAPNISDDILSDLLMNLDYQSVAANLGNAAEFHSLDVQFHDRLVEPLGFQKVKVALEAAASSLQRVRRLLSKPEGSGEKPSPAPVHHADTIRQHQAILKGLQNHDPIEAAAAMENHLSSTLAEFVRWVGAREGILTDP